MSEIKRVQLADADEQTASSTKNVSASKSIRFDFELFEPTADSFPEFNYSKLLYEEKKKQKKIVKKVNGFADPFEDNDDDVNRIAKEFERKYGTTCAGKKRSSNNNDCDKGAGYDLNDVFIDNSEAYDELIPDEIETDRGGFYINSGALEFKNLPNYERPDDAARMPKPKKRSLSISSDSSSSGNEEPNKKPNSTKNGPNEKKPKLSEKDKHKNKEKKLKVKDKKEEAPGYDSEKDMKKVVKTTTVKDMLRAKRDSMRNMIDNGNKSEQTEDSNKDTSSSEDSSDSSEDGSDGEKKESGCVQNGDAKLPDNLPAELLANIKRITEASKVTSSGKSNFFDSTNMNLLFEIDTAARMKGAAVRNQVYNYLEKYLPCTKQTILVRAKKIRSQKEEAKTNKILKKLKVAVGNVMPDLLISYEKECELVNDLKVSVNGSGKSEQTIKNPKKKFLWTDATRNVLCEVINSRKQAYAVIKPRRENITDFVNRYLSENVLRIWPDGWMTVEELLKEFDKRQLNSVKKSKENKKSIENASQQLFPDAKQAASETTSTTLSNTASTNSVATSHASLLNEVKSILSSNNSIVPNLKETSVTVVPSAKSEDTKTSNAGTDVTKSTTSPAPSFGSNLTITPIGLNDKMTAKPLASVQNQVTITNVDSLSQPSKVLTTTPAITQHANKTATKDQPIVKTSSSTSSSNSVNHNATKSTTKTPPLPADMLSPPKKATDHSISSIISLNAPVNSHSKSENAKQADLPSSGGTTRVINLDNLSTNDILSTAAASSETNIRIKSVESLNKSVPKNPAAVTNPTKAVNSSNKDKDGSTSKKPHSGSNSQSTASIQKSSAVTAPKASIPVDTIIKSAATAAPKQASQGVNPKSNFGTSKPTPAQPSIQKPVIEKTVSTLIAQSVEEISSDSDDVEFVSETHIKKSKNATSNVIKNIKRSNHSSRSSSPSSNAQANLPSRRRRDSSIDGKEELDVKQIMEAIKELQEMQTNATGVHSSGSNSSHNKKSLHHSSSLPYNKKLDHLEHTSQLSKSSS